MVRMIRKQVMLSPKQHATVKRRARSRDISESDVLREGIEQLSRLDPDPSLDRKAWLRERRFIMRRAALKAGAGRSWTREGLYDERLRPSPG